MELGLIATFAVLLCLCIILAIDEMSKHEYQLGEEWDFITPNSCRKN